MSWPLTRHMHNRDAGQRYLHPSRPQYAAEGLSRPINGAATLPSYRDPIDSAWLVTVRVWSQVHLIRNIKANVTHVTLFDKAECYLRQDRRAVHLSKSGEERICVMPNYVVRCAAVAALVVSAGALTSGQAAAQKPGVEGSGCEQLRSSKQVRPEAQPQREIACDGWCDGNGWASSRTSLIQRTVASSSPTQSTAK